MALRWSNQEAITFFNAEGEKLHILAEAHVFDDIPYNLGYRRNYDLDTPLISFNFYNAAL